MNSDEILRKMVEKFYGDWLREYSEGLPRGSSVEDAICYVLHKYIKCRDAAVDAVLEEDPCT